MKHLLHTLFLSACFSTGLSAQEKKPTQETNTPPARGERQPDKLKVGDLAPDFTLPSPDAKVQVKLSQFQGKKPVVLIFGSHT